jgi:muconolactone D-isomerase
VQFLVHIRSRERPVGDEAFLDELTARERQRGLELIDAGVIRDIWRIAGSQANVGIWEAVDATELHAQISSLPAFPWLDVDVTALAAHPLRPGTLS